MGDAHHFTDPIISFEVFVKEAEFAVETILNCLKPEKGVNEHSSVACEVLAIQDVLQDFIEVLDIAELPLSRQTPGSEE